MIRSRLPALRTLPSSTVPTSNASPILRKSCSPRNRNADVRRDDTKARHLGEGVDDFFRQSVAEVIVLFIGAHVGERKHCYRRGPFRELRPDLLHGSTRPPLWSQLLNRRNEAVPTLWQGFDEPWRCRGVGEHFTNLGDRLVQARVEVDEGVRVPHSLGD